VVVANEKQNYLSLLTNDKAIGIEDPTCLKATESYHGILDSGLVYRFFLIHLSFSFIFLSHGRPGTYHDI
jgi:hypothetical protein